jgi:hypothetical protein
MEPGFGDLVRIVSTPETERAGIAGLLGRVRGETQPSASGVAVIGRVGVADDFALQVQLDGRSESHWVTLDLVEFIDPRSAAQSPGSEEPRARPKTEEWQKKDLPSSGWQRFLARLRGDG